MITTARMAAVTQSDTTQNGASPCRGFGVPAQIHPTDIAQGFRTLFRDRLPTKSVPVPTFVEPSLATA
jgi:hypothetical protein